MTTAHGASRIVQNLLAYGASEVAAKLSRLLVVVAVARTLDLHQIGVAAAALAAGDILKALTENGVGQRIIAARDSELEAICATARRIFWAWCLGLFAVQALVGLALYATGGSLTLLLLILLLAGEYLFMPAGLVQAALAMRAGKLRQTAAISGGQVVAANLLSAGLALAWPSALALILPRLLTAPLWLVAIRRLHPWQPAAAAAAPAPAATAAPPEFTAPPAPIAPPASAAACAAAAPAATPARAPLAPFARFGAAVLGVEVVKALRLHADKLLVGSLMGAEALGLYFMAFNAGLSLATSFSTAFSRVLFPHLCASQNPTRALRDALTTGLLLITPLVLAQALLAPVYVPLLLGPGWEALPPVVSVLCLVALPTLVWTAAAGWLRAQDRAGEEFRLTALITAALMLNTALLAPHGVAAVAMGYTLTATLLMLLASRPALTAAFGRPRHALAEV